MVVEQRQSHDTQCLCILLNGQIMLARKTVFRPDFVDSLGFAWMVVAQLFSVAG